MACDSGADPELIKLLVAKGPSGAINTSVNFGQYLGTPLHVAASRDAADAVQALLEFQDIDLALKTPDALGRTALHVACAVANPGCANAVRELLLSPLVDRNLADDTGAIPLRLAVEKNADEVVDLLLTGHDNLLLIIEEPNGPASSILLCAEKLNLSYFEACDLSDPLTFEPTAELVSSDRIVKALFAKLDAGGRIPASHIDATFEGGKIPSDIHYGKVAAARKRAHQNAAALALQCMARSRQARMAVAKKRRAVSRQQKGKRKH